MMFDDDDYDERIMVPTLTVILAAAVACVIFFWLPLFLYSWHWWLR